MLLITNPRAVPCCAMLCLQAIVQMARASDKDGLRTIGVLTKADTIEAGTHNNWLRVLQGQNYPLTLGYFCVVNPSQVRPASRLQPASQPATNSNGSTHSRVPVSLSAAFVLQTYVCAAILG